MTSSATPEDAKPQHILALERANGVRLARAKLKKAIGRGEVTVEEVLAPKGAVPPEAETMGISELLRAQRRWGYIRARKLLVRLGVREEKTLGSLTTRQRQQIVAALAMPLEQVRDCGELPSTHAHHPV